MKLSDKQSENRETQFELGKMAATDWAAKQQTDVLLVTAIEVGSKDRSTLPDSTNEILDKKDLSFVEGFGKRVGDLYNLRRKVQLLQVRAEAYAIGVEFANRELDQDLAASLADIIERQDPEETVSCCMIKDDVVARTVVIWLKEAGVLGHDVFLDSGSAKPSAVVFADGFVTGVYSVLRQLPAQID